MSLARSSLAPTLLVTTAAAFAAGPPITLEVDATDVAHAIQHAHLTIPAHAGTMTLAYPKWIPGEHAADGPITQVVSLVIKAGGPVLPWQRDPLDPFSLRVKVPSGVAALDVQFDYLSPPKVFSDGYGRTPNMSQHLQVLPFNHLVLYPREAAADSVMVQARVRLPAGWKHDGALHPERTDGDTLTFPTVSLTTLIDSPLLAGEYFRTVPLTEGSGSTRVSIAADAPGDLAVPEAMIGAWKHLVSEAVALFGPGHYREYVWLMALSDPMDRNGLEHHESTDIRDHEALFTDAARRTEHRTNPHEYVHSWNGKYRRPAGLATRNYQEPMVDDLLWVYEGMTRYLGDLVLRTRSGQVTPEESRAYLAWIAARSDRDRPGRAWRSLGDTATAVPAYSEAPDEWTPIRRARDYYDEMMLVWLDADTLIRESSGGTRSLDDFCSSFFGGPERAPALRPYTRSDVVSALKSVAAHDWDAFFAARVENVNPHAPLDGLARSGWKLVYDDTPNEFQSAREKVDEADNLGTSLGVHVKSSGEVTDVVHGSPAFAAGIAPGMRIESIAGHKWSIDAARAAIIAAEKSAAPLELIVEAGDTVRVLHLDYHGGLQYPHLVRDAAKPDLLSRILAPKTGT
ncbi:MAG TPA: M61 family peptidase [Candidatus Dormibacteraeota bacterium]|nr:M61 family peptidase [Candidatus Dormibacteraeota bacterium]